MILAEQILKAPDQFMAAVIMKKNEFFFGRGDFQNAIDLLTKGKNLSYKDIANKLVMLKTGFFWAKGIQADINQEDTDEFKNPGILIFRGQKFEEKQRVKLYSDKSRKLKVDTNHTAINYKHVFQIWKHWVY